jgi:hypothetical protein
MSVVIASILHAESRAIEIAPATPVALDLKRMNEDA